MKRIRGQSEIMGLAMVVILIVLGLLLYVKFGIDTSGSSLTNEFTNKQLPVLLNKAIFETHATEEDCYGEKIQKILISSAEGKNLVCSNGQPFKVFAREFIENSLNQTLGEWQMEYIYSVYKGQDFSVCEPSSFNSNLCVMSITNSEDYCFMMDRYTENFFFRLNTGQLLNIKLDICR